MECFTECSIKQKMNQGILEIWRHLKIGALSWNYEMFISRILIFLPLFLTPKYSKLSFKVTGMCLCRTLWDLLHFSSAILLKIPTNQNNSNIKTKTKQNQNTHQNLKSNISSKIFIPARTHRKQLLIEYSEELEEEEMNVCMLKTGKAVTVAGLMLVSLHFLPLCYFLESACIIYFKY